MNRFTLYSIGLGAALVTTGAALIYHPLGFVVSGVFVLTAGILSAKGRK
jgi:hypothetical protein